MDPRCLGVKLAAKYPNTDIDSKCVYSPSIRTKLESKCLENFSLKFETVLSSQTRNCIVSAWFIRQPVLSAKQRLNPSSIYSFSVKYHLIFENMSCPVCAQCDYNILVENIKELGRCHFW